VVSYLKHLEGNSEDFATRQDINLTRFRKVGDDLISHKVLHESVSDGKCFQVSRKIDDLVVEAYSFDLVEEAINWFCEDDLENYWRHNCLVLHPTITTCMDELAILKHVGDAANLDKALSREESDSKTDQFFYNFDFLA